MWFVRISLIEELKKFHGILVYEKSFVKYYQEFSVKLNNGSTENLDTKNIVAYIIYRHYRDVKLSQYFSSMHQIKYVRLFTKSRLKILNWKKKCYRRLIKLFSFVYNFLSSKDMAEILKERF